MDILFSVPAGTDTSAIYAVTGNIIGPVPGRAASMDDNGNIVPAVGDPSRDYYNVRLNDGQAIDLPVGAETTDPVLSEAILGVWA